MAFQVQGFRIFRALLVILVLLLCVSLCDGSTITTMMPSGFQKRKAGDLVSVTCTFPTSSGNLRFEYNGVDSPILDAKKGRETVVIATAKSSTLTVKAVGFGLNAAKTGIAVQLDFNLTADHNGSTLRCKFDSTASADDSSQSKYFKLTVLFPPCCDVSPPVFVNHNTTDPSLPLNCSEIVNSHGNPPVCLQWNLSPSDSKFSKATVVNYTTSTQLAENAMALQLSARREIQGKCSTWL
eukprot:m.187045 g.187045  ORF g.187045 m.187045 type:complete len:239 (+) comp39357_c1_seq73:100-816(+)